MQRKILAICDPNDQMWVEKLKESTAACYTIDTVGENQIDKASINEYEIILLDAGAVENAPKMIGRLHLNWPQASIIVVTSSPDWKLVRQCYLAGASDYVNKMLAGEAIRSAVY